MSSRSQEPGPSRSRFRFPGLPAVAVSLAALLLALAAAELGLRAIGRKPARGAKAANEPILLEPDPVLGWRNRPGRYSYPGYSEGSRPIEVTTWPDGSRATAREPVASRESLVFVGCSFTAGWAVSDAETMPWKIQERFPALRVRNFGTAAYGTLQSLLLLERILGERADAPRLVVYGFTDFHPSRNAADAAWLEALARTRSRRHTSLPFAALTSAGEIVRRPPTKVPAFPLRESSALVALAEAAHRDLLTAGRAGRARAITELILQELDRRTREHGSRLLVARLVDEPEGERPYGEFLARAGIANVDCTDPRYDTAETKVAGEGHPNGVMNTIWADCVEKAARETLAGRSSLPP